jgi:hypothetical protein
VCACVDSEEVAIAFGKMFQLRAVINGHIPSQEHYPDFGQLGCSGFIVVDKDGRCVSRKTVSYNQHGPDAAFADVERLLRPFVSENGRESALAAMPDDSPYAVGAVAMLEGLDSSLALNGRHVTVLGFDTSTQRFVVELQRDDSSLARKLAVRPCNLTPLPDFTPASIAPPAATGCAAIDSEHEACTSALNALLCSPDSGNALASAVTALAAHFEHEEALLRSAGWGGGGGDDDGGALSAFNSHAADHARLLAPARAELARLQGRELLAEVTVSRSLAKGFMAHAAAFDVLFEGHLPADAV